MLTHTLVEHLCEAANVALWLHLECEPPGADAATEPPWFSSCALHKQRPSSLLLRLRVWKDEAVYPTPPFNHISSFHTAGLWSPGCGNQSLRLLSISLLGLPHFLQLLQPGGRRLGAPLLYVRPLTGPFGRGQGRCGHQLGSGALCGLLAIWYSP